MNQIEQVPAWKKYPIIHKGEVVSYLNASLVERKGVSPQNVKALLQLHGELRDEFDAMEATDDPRELRRLAMVIAQIEFEQQRMWGFPMDFRFHNWYGVPKCTCPKLDNADAKGTDYWIINPECPVHNLGLEKIHGIVELNMDKFSRVADEQSVESLVFPTA